MSRSEEIRTRADSVRSTLPAWIDSSSYPVGVVDESGVVAYVNDAALNVFGISADLVLGHPVSEFIDPSDQPTFRLHRQLTSRGEGGPYVLRFGVCEDSRRDFLVLAEGFRDGTGEIHGSVAVFLELPALAARMRTHLERAADEGRDLLDRIQPPPNLEHLRLENEALAGLTPRQWQVAVEVYRGRRVRNVAIDLDLSEHTVRTHLKSVFRKLDVVSQSDLVDWIDDLLRANPAD
jgi:PAS domain S-box-containing protein